MAEPLRPLSYRELTDWHRELADESPDVFGSMSLSNFSQRLNSVSGQRIADQGVHDSFIKRASTNIDRGIEWTGAPEAAGAVGRGIGNIFGEQYGEIGQRVGEKFPRGAVNFAPLIAAEVFSGGAATPFVAGALASGAMSGADTYTETGSAGAGVVSGVASALVPAAFRTGGQLALKATGASVFSDEMAALATSLGKTSVPEAGKLFATGAGQKTAEFIGGNIGAIIEGEIAGQASSVIQGQGLYNPVSPEHLFETAAGILPWAALGVPGLRRSTAAEFVSDFMSTSAKARKADMAAAGQRIAAGVPTASDYELTQTRPYTDVVEFGHHDLVRDFRFPKAGERSIYRFAPEGNEPMTVRKLGEKDGMIEVRDINEANGKSFFVTSNDISPTEFVTYNRNAPDYTDLGFTRSKPSADVRTSAKVGEQMTFDMGALRRSVTTAPAEVMGIPDSVWQDKQQMLLGEWKNPDPSLPPQPDPQRGMTSQVQGRDIDVREGLEDFYQTRSTNESVRRTPGAFGTNEPLYSPPGVEAAGRELLGKYGTSESPLSRPFSDLFVTKLAEKDKSVPAKPTTVQVREHVTETVTLRKTLREKFGVDIMPTVTDAEVGNRIQEFSRFNPNHSDPMAGFAEAFRAETVRKAQEEDALRHAGKSIGVEERTVNEAMERLSKAPKGVDGLPGDADTVARIVGEFDHEQTLGVTEAIYRAYGTFAKDRESTGRSYSQAELAANLAQAAKKGIMKGEERLAGKQVSLDKPADNAPGGEEAVFAQLDPGIKQEREQQAVLERELHEDTTVAGHDVAAISDDIRLIGTLGKLSWLVKERPEAWDKIWSRNRLEGEVRTRIYINHVFDKMQARAGKVTPSELNQLFAAYDAIHGSKLAYMDKGKLASGLPAGLFEKLTKTFELIAALPDFGVEGAKGDRQFLASQNLTESPRGTERAGLITAKALYTRLFRERMGYSKELSDAMTEQMMRIVATFSATSDRTRLTSLEGGDLGAYIKSFGNPLWTGVVGIAEKSFGNVQKNTVMHQLVLAHELTHGAENAFTLMRDTGAQLMHPDTFAAFSRMEEISQQLTPEQRSQFLGEVRDMLLGEKFKSKELDQILSNSAVQAGEFRATMGAMLAMNRVGELPKSSASFKELMLNAPKEFADFAKGMVRYIGDMARALWSSLRGDEVLKTQLGISSESKTQLSSVSQEYFNLMNNVLSTTKQVDQAVARLQQFEQLSPSAYSMLVQANRVEPIQTSAFEGAPGFAVELMAKVKEEIGLNGETPTQPTFLQRNLEQFTQLSERYPVLRKISNIAFTAQHATERNLNKLFSLLAMDVDATGKGKMDPKLTNTMAVAQNLSAREAFSEVARAQQDTKGFLDRKHPRVVAALGKLSPTLQEQTWSLFEKVNTQNQLVANERVTGLQEINGLIVSKFLQELEPTRPVEATEQIGQQFMKALAAQDVATMGQLTTQLQATTVQKVSQLALSLHEGWTKLATQTQQQPWYFTERRYGDFVLVYKNKEGKTGRASADSQAQIDAIEARETRSGSTILNRLTPEDMRKPMSQYSDGYRQAVIEAQDKSMAQLETLLKDDPELLAKMRPLLEIEADATAEMQSNDTRKLNPFRKHAPGREYVDYLDASSISNAATVRGLQRRWLRAKSALYTLDPELAKEPALQRLATNHIDNVLTTDSPLGQAVSKANFYYYVVGNLANMMQEPFQQLGTILPALQREGGGLIRSGASLVKANAAIAKFWQTGKTGNAEHDQVLARFAADRENPHGFLSEFDSESLGAINAVRFANGKSVLERGAALAKPLTHLVDLARNAYLKVPEHNARVTMLAAYDLGRSKGMTSDAAYQDAVRIYRYSNFAGGKAGRAVGVYSGRDPFTKSAAQTVMSLQTYQTGYISMMSRLISEGFGKGRLEGAEGKSAKKAALTMLGVQFVMAGALGMPFAGQGVALLQQLFPNLELEKNIRLGLDSAFGDDSELGGFVTNSITHGVVGESLGVDLSTRFGLGNMFGMSTMGYDPTQVLGPTGGLVRNMVLGIQDTATGDYAKSVQDIVPPQLKRIVNTYREGGEFRDNAGNLLFEGTDTEKAFRLMGYTPSRERDVREQQRIIARGEKISQGELNKFYEGMVDRIETGDYAGVRDGLQQRAKDDYSFDTRSGLRKVAQMAEQRLNPVDLRNQGNLRTADERSKVLATYNAQGGTSEVARLQQRANLERLVGIVGAGHISQTEVRLAAMTDHLTQRYPFMTKDQVKALASQQIQRQMTAEQRSAMIPEGL